MSSWRSPPPPSQWRACYILYGFQNIILIYIHIRRYVFIRYQLGDWTVSGLQTGYNYKSCFAYGAARACDRDSVLHDAISCLVRACVYICWDIDRFDRINTKYDRCDGDALHWKSVSIKKKKYIYNYYILCYDRVVYTYHVRLSPRRRDKNKEQNGFPHRVTGSAIVLIKWKQSPGNTRGVPSCKIINISIV